MITIPSAYSTGLSSHYPVLFIVKIYLDNSGNVLYICSKPNVLTQLSVTDRSIALDSSTNWNTNYLTAEIDDSPVDGIGEIDYQISPEDGGGISTVNTAKLIFLNHLRFDEFVSQYDIENADIEIWQGFLKPSGSMEITNEMILIYKGVVTDAGNWDYSQFEIPCVDRRHVDSIPIPSNRITLQNYPHAPIGVVNQVLPIILGDLYSPNENSGPTYYMSEKVQQLIASPTILIDQYHQYLYPACHPIKGTGRVFCYASPGYWVGILRWDGADHTYDWFTDSSGLSYVKIAQGAYGNVFVSPNAVGSHNSPSSIDISPAVDNDESNYVAIGAAQTASFTFGNFPSPGDFIMSTMPGGYAYDFLLHVVIDNFSDGGSGGSIRVVMYNTLTGGSAVLGTLTANGTFSLSYTGLPAFGVNSWNDVQNLEFAFTGYNGGSARLHQVIFDGLSSMNFEQPVIITQRGNSDILGRYFQPAKQIYRSQISTISNVFASIKGAFPSSNWMRTASGLIVSDPVPLLDNPAYAIEWILREMLKVDPSHINTDSFDAIGAYPVSANGFTKGSRSKWDGWQISASIINQQDAIDVMKQICFEFGLILTLCPNSTNGNDEYKLIALPTKDDAAVYTITTHDILFDKKPQITVDYTPLSKMYNDIYLPFNLQCTNQNNIQSIYLSDINGDGTTENNLYSDSGAPDGGSYSSWILRSVTKYRTRNRFNQSLDYIADSVMAELIIKRLADWWAFKRVVCKIGLMKNVNTLALQVGDIVKVSCDILGNIYSNNVTFMVTKVTYPPVSRTSDPFFHLECEEIPNQYTGTKISRALPNLQRV